MVNLAPVSVRMTPAEREMIEDAAEMNRTNLSDYIRRKALEAAEMDLMDRRIVTIPAEKWEEFESWANRPAEYLPEVAKLMASKPVWEK